MSADLLTTIDLCNRLKAVLAAIYHPTIEGEKLFEVVDFHEDKNLAEALQQLIIVKQRVCLIVPAGDNYVSERMGRSVRSTRTTVLDIVMADRSYLKGGQEAAFGGPKNVGVVAMKEITTKAIAENPQLSSGDPATPLRWCALRPVEGAMLTLTDSDEAKAPGRQAWVLNYDTPSGEIITPFVAAWPAAT